MKTVPTIITCAFVLGIGAGGVFLLNRFKAEPVAAKIVVNMRVVSSQVVHNSSKRIDVTTHGTVTPRTEISLIAQVSGEVTSISSSLENGGFFAAEDVLVQLDLLVPLRVFHAKFRRELVRVGLLPLLAEHALLLGLRGQLLGMREELDRDLASGKEALILRVVL